MTDEDILTAKKYYAYKVHPSCLEIRKKENAEFDELCKYVHRDIMLYGEHLKISKFIVMRLKGLRNGQFYANKERESKGSYTYKEIMLTFKAKKIDILSATKGKSFESDQGKFNYVMAIIENSINEIAERLERVAKQEHKNKDFTIESLQKQEDKYKNSKNDKENKAQEMLKSLW